MLRSLALLILILAGTLPAQSPLSWRWSFEGNGNPAEGTPSLRRATGSARRGPDTAGGGLIFAKNQDALIATGPREALVRQLPREQMAVAAWVAVEEPLRWGGIVGCVEDDGGLEHGFVLGFREDRFSFALASEGADDGDGRLTYLAAKSAFVPGRWHHVVGTYDGAKLRVYVDGKLEAESGEQKGRIQHCPTAPFVIGAYQDANEHHQLVGRIRSVALDGRAWTADAVKAAYDADAALTKLPAWSDRSLDFLVAPYLTWPTTDAMSVLFEATLPVKASVTYRRDDEPESKAKTWTSKEAVALHECRIEGLQPDQKYFYRVKLMSAAGKEKLSPLLSFRTATSPGKPFTFVVVGDTQTNGQVAKRVSDLAYMHRPNLILHAGDLVDRGTRKKDWTHTFFPSMQPLISRTPLMPVLGNHEQDARHYYRYMSLPQPERWYSFRYGDAEFFMIDGNRSLEEQSEQLRWLEKALRASKALWRFAVLHQPPYTSDSNDYGNTLKGASKRGDLNVRNIVRLLEAHDVDLCFSGHVHDYERTFPIRGRKVVPYEKGGVIYVTAAGGGGSLEDFDPTNTWFGHKKARYHHLVYVALNGPHLEFQAIDEHGRLFDVLRLRKRGK